MTSMKLRNQRLKAVQTQKVIEDHRDIELPAQKSIFYRLLRHPYFMPYNRLATLVVLLNTIVFFNSPQLTSFFVGYMVLANFAIAIVIRSQYVINLLFKLATSIPTTWPLHIRWAAGKVYHFGGIHVGGFFSGSLWFAYLTYIVSRQGGPLESMLPVMKFHLGILTVMMIMALPQIRSKYHNQFEIVGRFGSWVSVILFWIQTLKVIVMSQPENLMLAIISSPQVMILEVITFVILIPWMWMQKVPVDIETPSNHVALTNFNYGVKPFAGSSTDLSRNPLFEWHSFANIPSPDKDGFRLTISRAGDWTGKLIEDKPKHLWVKGVPAAGVGNIELLFKRVIWVATGSGVGPCIPHLLTQEIPSKLIWATRDPAKTYGKELSDEIFSVQPDAVLWNTKENGKPDLVKLAYQAYKDFDAEAVICISNKPTTWHVAYELESRGIPTFGAIWDS